MTRAFALCALLLSSCATTPRAPQCAEIPVPEPVKSACDEDMDGDGILNCDDTDVDGDGLANIWDCDAGDPTIVEGPAGGLCTDGDLSIDRATSLASYAPSTLLSDDVEALDTFLPLAEPELFAVGDEIAIVHEQGTNAGLYEWVYVSEVTAAGVTIEPYLQHAYTISSDPNALVRVQRIPHFDNVTIGGTLTTEGWNDETGGGLLFFRACGTVQVAGSLDVQGLGFAGGQGVSGNDSDAYNGESWIGPSTVSLASDEVMGEYEIGANNAGGGGAPVIASVAELQDQMPGGGGGGYATPGEDGYGNDSELLALGGEVYGDEDLSSWYLGSGGGAGGPDTEEDDGNDERNVSGDGGSGGGMVAVFAKDRLEVSGTIDASGTSGKSGDSYMGEVGGGGGGSGGQVFLVSPSIAVTGIITVQGGGGGWPAEDGEIEEDREARGGHGGFGRVRVDAENLDLGDQEETIDSEGAYEGDIGQWCWEADPAFEEPCATDADGDGVITWECGGDDCDDEHADAHPGGFDETADGIDQDCDGFDACSELGWLQGGMPTEASASCASAGRGLSGLAGILAAGLALLRRRR